MLLSMGTPTRGPEAAEGSRFLREPLGPGAPLVGIENEVDEPPATLVRRAQQGDAWALDALVRSLVPYLGRLCGSVALDAGDDALQEALVAIVRNIGSLREPGAVRGWARTIAVREAVRVARGGRGGSGSGGGGSVSVSVDPDVLAATLPAVRDDATAVEVRAVLETLDPEQRAVLVLRYLDGMDQQTMAEVLDVAPGTVKSRLSRARTAFRARWTA
jgi:RNA polymerase sigma factor (sigma-70 family)